MDDAAWVNLLVVVVILALYGLAMFLTWGWAIERPNTDRIVGWSRPKDGQIAVIRASLHDAPQPQVEVPTAPTSLGSGPDLIAFVRAASAADANGRAGAAADTGAEPEPVADGPEGGTSPQPRRFDPIQVHLYLIGASQ